MGFSGDDVGFIVCLYVCVDGWGGGSMISPSQS